MSGDGSGRGSGTSLLDRLWRALADRPTVPAVATLVAAVLAVYGRALLRPGALIAPPVSDVRYAYYPWKRLVLRAVADGRLPLWNPYSFSGQPLLANPQAGAFFPFDITFLALPTAYAFTVGFAAFTLAAGVGTYLFCRAHDLARPAALVAGASFMLSDALLSRLFAGHYTIVAAVGLLPFVFLAVERALRRESLTAAVTFGVVAALQVLAGHLQYPYYTLGAALVYAVLRAGHLYAPRRGGLAVIRAYAVGGVVAGLLSAVQLLPTLYLSQLTDRGGGLAASNGAALFPKLLATAAVPELFGRPPGPVAPVGNYWEVGFYVGIPALVLAPFALAFLRERSSAGATVRAMGLIGAGALVLAVGPKLPLYGLFVRYVPLASRFRIPGRFMVLVAFATCVLAAVGYRALRDPDTRTRELWALPGLVLLAELAVLGALLAAPGFWVTDQFAGSRAIYDGAVASAVLAVLLTVATLAVLAYLSRPRIHPRLQADGRAVRVALVVLIIGPLVALQAPYADARPAGEVLENHPAVESVPADGRVFDMRPTLTTNAYRSDAVREETNALAGVRSVGGYNPLHVASSRRLIDRLDGEARDPLLDALAVEYVLTGADTDLGGEYTAVATARNTTVWANPDARGEAYFLDGGRPELTDTATVASARDLPMETPRPERATVRVGARGDGYVVFARTYYPLWTATADGDPVETERVDGLLAVPVEAGTERVTVRYRSWPLRAGAVLTALGLLLVTGVYLRAFRARDG